MDLLNQKAKQYIRKGECTKCGACCRALHSDPNWEQGMKNNVCNKLSKDGKCSIYKNRPEVCNEWPNSPSDLIYKKVKDQCGYWFEIIK